MLMVFLRVVNMQILIWGVEDKRPIVLSLKVLLRVWHKEITGQVKRIPQDAINGFITHSTVESVGSCRFQIHLRLVMNREFTHKVVNWISTWSNFNHFQSYQIQRSYCKIFTAYYACRNADLNLTLFMGTTTAFIFHEWNLGGAPDLAWLWLFFPQTV